MPEYQHTTNADCAFEIIKSRQFVTSYISEDAGVNLTSRDKDNVGIDHRDAERKGVNIIFKHTSKPIILPEAGSLPSGEYANIYKRGEKITATYGIKKLYITSIECTSSYNEGSLLMKVKNTIKKLKIHFNNRKLSKKPIEIEVVRGKEMFSFPPEDENEKK